MSGLRGWVAATPRKRLVRQWRPASLVLVVALVAATILATLVTLSDASERGAVRGALELVEPERTTIDVFLSYPSAGTAEAAATVDGAVEGLLGRPTLQSSVELSTMQTIPRVGAVPQLAYLGELDDIEAHVELVDGVWPTGRVPGYVAIPQIAADVLGVALGDTIAMAPGFRQPTVEYRVVGIYTPLAAESDYWDPDVLEGRGHDPAFPVPGTFGGLRVDAVGPFIAAPGAIDALGLERERLVLRHQPDLSAVTSADLAGLRADLDEATTAIPTAIGEVAANVYVSTELDTVVRETAAGVALTRSTVAVVSLMLLVLSIAVLTGAARLLAASRAGERRLLRSRGASRGQLVTLAAGEGVVLAALVAVGAPLLAGLLYRALATSDAMAAAGMPAEAGFVPLAWFAGAVLGVVALAILLGPAFSRDELDGARQERAPFVQRSGIDIAVIALAGVAYWQVAAYSGTVGDGIDITPDPILAVSPALIVLAGALACVRLVPPLARAADGLAAGARGAAVALAAWQVARRPVQLVAMVLLLALAIGVGSFTQSFLVTWRQAQLDQSAFAVGAPIRVTGGAGAAEAPAGDPEPTALRDALLVADESTGFGGIIPGAGEEAQILAITAGARSMLERGRTGETSGVAIAEALGEAPATSYGVELPEGTALITAELRAWSAEDVPDLRITARVVLEHPSGAMTVHELQAAAGSPAEFDGEPTTRTALLDLPTEEGARIVAFQASVAFASGSDADVIEGDAIVMIRGLASSPEDGGRATALTVDPEERWNAYGDDVATQALVSPLRQEGWQYGMDFTIPAGLETGLTVTTMGWPTVVSIPSVVDASTAAALDVGPSSRLRAVLDAVPVPIAVRDVVEHVPGVGSQSGVVVVDQTLLARSLVQSGVTRSLVDQWWVDLPADEHAAYLAALPEGLVGVSGPVSGEEQLGHPLRVAVELALRLVAVGAAVLAAIGFAIHGVGALRARRLEFARLRALGLDRRALVGIVGVETLLAVVLGAAFGLGIGILLAYLLGPLIGTGVDPVPPVLVVIPPLELALTVAVVAVVYAIVVIALALAQRRAHPAAILREVGE